jgi:hypothetical protein
MTDLMRVIEEALTDDAMVRAAHAEEVIKRQAIANGGFEHDTQHNALQAARSAILAALSPDVVGELIKWARVGMNGEAQR